MLRRSPAQEYAKCYFARALRGCINTSIKKCFNKLGYSYNDRRNYENCQFHQLFRKTLGKHI